MAYLNFSEHYRKRNKPFNFYFFENKVRAPVS